MGNAGTSIGPASIGFVNLAKCLELALHNGRCAVFNRRIGPETGDARSFTGYEELLEAYAKQVHFAMTQFNQSVSAIEMGHERLRPIPFLSSITDNAMETGLGVNPREELLPWDEHADAAAELVDALVRRLERDLAMRVEQPPAELGSETLERLRSLGYVQ